VVQLRPRVAHRDRKIRHGIRWYYRMGRRVWFHEIWNFRFRDRRVLPERQVFGVTADSTCG
jgi:anaerobic magnesium-protoporphyrin IX monomethyl ester cyclase